MKDEESGQPMVYGIFTTPSNSIGASALCAFYMKDILSAFESPFKGQETLTSNWLPIPEENVPNPRPGSCASAKTPMDSNSYAFVRKNSLMEESVQGTIVLTIPSNEFKVRSFAVSQHLGQPYRIFYLGTG